MCCLGHFVRFDVFGSLDILDSKEFEIILHSSNKGQISVKGGISGDAFFFYLPRYNF
jgi:hypothetical protein